MTHVTRAEVARYLRAMANRTRELAVEYDGRADAYTDPDTDLPSDRGHTWRFKVEVRGSSKARGEKHYQDAPEFCDVGMVVEVRAWNLRAALGAAAALPLAAWFPGEGEGGAVCPLAGG